MKSRTILRTYTLVLFIIISQACNSNKAVETSSTPSPIANDSTVVPQSQQSPPLKTQQVPSSINKSENKRGKRKLQEAEYEFSKDDNSAEGIYSGAPQVIDRENYGRIVENSFESSSLKPLSTFSLDVDRASYSNVRRMLLSGTIPPPDAVRIEEMVNYFNYDYEEPSGNDPIKLHSQLTSCPWNTDHQILQVGLQAKDIALDNLPSSNLVFLLDVSGSMNQPHKLPLVKSAFKILLNKLRPEDRVAIVTYAGHAGIALESTPVSEKSKILKALKNLTAGGSTAGAQGINTAYEIAEHNFIKGGNNRVILATDGDFNVGVNSAEGLESLIEKKRKSNIFLSVLGFGTGNYQDHQMQTLANKGNGNHAYIDNLLEAQKVLVNEFGGTMFTLAKDVKIQIEFNPAYVAAYRLIGYENRLLNKEDFNDDTKDAGEIGSGHSMTALYEIIPQGVKSNFVASVDPLKYQTEKVKPIIGEKNNELATIKFRYKQPEGNTSKMISQIVYPGLKDQKDINAESKFMMAVAEFGMILRSSEYVQQANLEQVIALAKETNLIEEKDEFIQLVKLYQSLIQ